jgi:hypothetical protein
MAPLLKPLQITPASLAPPQRRGPRQFKRPQNWRDVPPEYQGDPIHLTASVAGMPPSASGVGVNVKALKNSGPGPIELLGMKFRLRSPGVIANGALVDCRLDLGSYPLTNGFVPIYSFGRAQNIVAEQVMSPGNPPGFVYSEYIVPFSRPLYLPVGAVVRPQFRHKGQSTAAVDVQISMFGRMLSEKAPLPKKLMLPYWAAYACKTFTLGTVDSDTSSESDLYNPFETPLHLERFVGRISFIASNLVFSAATGSPVAMTELEQGALAPLGNNGGLGDTLGQITCQIVDSNGYPVVKKPTPFRLVFDAITRSWPLTNDLPPGGYYVVTLNNLPWTSQFGSPFGVAAVTAQPCVSMVGWREVR